MTPDELFKLAAPQLEALPRPKLLELLQKSLQASALAMENLQKVAVLLRAAEEERDELKSKCASQEAELIVLRNAQ
jgi:hypothetical protein